MKSEGVLSRAGLAYELVAHEWLKASQSMIWYDGEGSNLIPYGYRLNQWKCSSRAREAYESAAHEWLGHKAAYDIEIY